MELGKGPKQTRDILRQIFQFSKGILCSFEKPQLANKAL